MIHPGGDGAHVLLLNHPADDMWSLPLAWVRPAETVADTLDRLCCQHLNLPETGWDATYATTTVWQIPEDEEVCRSPSTSPSPRLANLPGPGTTSGGTPTKSPRRCTAAHGPSWSNSSASRPRPDRWARALTASACRTPCQPRSVLVKRLRDANGGKIPLVARYDHHKRVTGPQLPHLFQRRPYWQAQVMNESLLATGPWGRGRAGCAVAGALPAART